MKRLRCTYCGNDVPRVMANDRDVQSEDAWYAAAHAAWKKAGAKPKFRPKVRPWYCSARCFRIVRDHLCGQVHDAPHAALACSQDHGTAERRARMAERSKVARAARRRRPRSKARAGR